MTTNFWYFDGADNTGLEATVQTHPNGGMTITWRDRVGDLVDERFTTQEARSAVATKLREMADTIEGVGEAE
jgi:hypothetical protein